MCLLFFLLLPCAIYAASPSPQVQDAVAQLLAGKGSSDPRGLLRGGVRLLPHTRTARVEAAISPPGGADVVASVLKVRLSPEGRAAEVELLGELRPPRRSARVRCEGLERGAKYLFCLVARRGGKVVAARVLGEITVPALFAWQRLRVLVFVVLFVVLYGIFVRLSRTRTVFLRRIAGIGAIEEAIGRATEMGKPVLYVPGLEDQTDVQTLSSLVILGHVGRRAAEYGVRLIVPTRSPVVMTMAQEVVREACAVSGRGAGAFVEDDVRYLSDEQFAFCAGVDGIMVRERPAANLFLGYFYAESLILAETGYASGAIQVAGTAAVAQIPFFIVACDYTMIGEEFYAASAYLSKDPEVVAGIKAADWLKVTLIVLLAVGGVCASLAQLPEARQLALQVLQILRHPEQLLLGGG